MAQFPRTDRDGLETWLASQIANLTTIVTPPEAGILLLHAQITDSENRCAATHDPSHSKTVRTAILRAAF